MFRKKTKKTYDDDDGRVIAPMNVDGMPWYRKGKSDSLHGESHGDSGSKEPPLTRKETLVLILNGALAGLAVALVLGALGALFILFLTNVWLR
ncbi:MAG TPA: hypothetical protein PK629_11975 [Oscillospiraceae bacterium]|nr:hypothetical protein [Oscillospiraceae bacterium]HPF55865.1 hypothetical protein [Clostridiales bacterium]HPK36437.1 hypothetical protein [Oscillospiraceae bacterium]HPR76378.1 hypothetical protein [Oscillospiraceae bacterium]